MKKQPIKLHNAWGHLRTVHRHRKEVMKNCFRAGIPLQGLLHDLSKYSPEEFINGCRYFQGSRSPHEGERDDYGYSLAWMHHKGRNKHHPVPESIDGRAGTSTTLNTGRTTTR